jgi:hypothetical protein
MRGRRRPKPDRGIVHWRWEMLNQDDEVVLSILGTQFFLRREELRLLFSEQQRARGRTAVTSTARRTMLPSSDSATRSMPSRRPVRVHHQPHRRRAARHATAPIVRMPSCSSMCIATMPAASTATSAGLPRMARRSMRNLEHVVAADRNARAAEVGALGAVLRDQHFDELLRQFARVLDRARIEIPQRIRDADILAGLRFEPELVGARADQRDEILSPDQDAGARPGDVLVGRAHGEVDLADLERRRLVEERDARSHVRVVDVDERVAARGSASACLNSANGMWRFDALIGVISSRRGAPASQAFFRSAYEWNSRSSAPAIEIGRTVEGCDAPPRARTRTRGRPCAAASSAR